MDVRREPASPKRRRLHVAAAGTVVLLVTVALVSLDPAAPSVDRNSVLIGTVDRGSFTREVRGPGTLVAEQIVFVTALTGGRVEQVLAQPGQAVADTTLLLVLSNPDVQLEFVKARIRGE